MQRKIIYRGELFDIGGVLSNKYLSEHISSFVYPENKKHYISDAINDAYIFKFAYKFYSHECLPRSYKYILNLVYEYKTNIGWFQLEIVLYTNFRRRSLFFNGTYFECMDFCVNFHKAKFKSLYILLNCFKISR